MIQSLEHYLGEWGLLALFIGTFLEGETILILAGMAASRGMLNLHQAIFCAFLGSMLGDQAVFLFARHKSDWAHKKIEKWKEKAQVIFNLLEKNSVWLLISFRFFYGLRNLISIAAGLTQIPKKKFLFLNAIGAMVWALAFGYGGFYLGKAMIRLMEDAKKYEMLGAILFSLVIAFLIIYKKKKNSDKSS